MYRIVLLAMVIIGSTTHLQAQEKFKFGLGVNYVSNTYEQEHLYDYMAPSLNLGYKLYSSKTWGLTLENATTFRSSGSSDERDYKLGFTTAFPLLAQLNLGKVGLTAGTGPAYVRQRSFDYSHNESASGYYLGHVFGAGFSGKPLLGSETPVQYQLRITYLKSISQPAYDGGLISFIVFLKS